MARRIGVVDDPGERAPPQRAAGPAPRRARALPRDPRPGARVPRPRAGIARLPARRRRRRPRSARSTTSAASTWWQKLGGQVARRGGAVGFGVYVDRFTFPFVGIHELPDWVGDRRDARLDRRAHEHGQLPRRPGRARGRRLRDRRRHVRGHRALAGEARRRGHVRDRRRRLLRLPAPQLLSGADLHGRLRRAAARLRARDGRRPGALEDRSDRRALLPAASCSRSRSSTPASWSPVG